MNGAGIRFSSTISNIGNTPTVMSIAGTANRIVRNHKYDSLYRLTEAEAKKNTTEGVRVNAELGVRGDCSGV